MPEASNVRVLSVASCPSLSGRSNLIFQVGCDEEKSIHLRVVENSGKGYFNKNWISFEAVNDLLLESTPLTFNTLQPLYAGLSINNAGFLLAALKSLGVVELNPENPRVHKRGAVEDFIVSINALAETENSLGDSARPESGKGRRKGVKATVEQ